MQDELLTIGRLARPSLVGSAEASREELMTRLSIPAPERAA
ncbi:hypothetical protein [Nocardia sp. NPDC057440]